MTQQDGAPLTRRALRTQAADAARVPSTTPSPQAPADATPHAPTRPGETPRVLTRRELRLAASSVSTDVAGPSSPVSAAPVATTPAGTTPAGTTPAGTTPVGTTPATERPLTRREIRLRDRALALATSTDDAADASSVAGACRPPFVASLVLPLETPDAGAVPVPRTPEGAGATRRVVTTRPDPARQSRRDARHGTAHAPGARRPATSSARQLFAHAGRKPVAVVALSAGLLTAGVTQVQAEQGVVAQAQAALDRSALEAVERQERQERSATASSHRLMAQAAAYAAAQRSQALAAAQEAVAAATGTSEIAAPVLDADAVGALEAAASELAALLEAAPSPELAVVDEDDVETVLAETDDAAEIRADQPSRAVSPEGREPLPASATDDTAADDAASVAPTETTTDDGDEPVQPAAVEEVDALPGGEATAAQLVEALPDLDIAVSRRIQAQTELVAALTEQVQELAETKIAEAEAAAAAAEAQRLAEEAAAQAAAAELARKVAVAKDAPNGQIPQDVLCGVGFADGVLLRCDAAAALEQLNAAYRADFGRDLTVVSSYRSYDAQVVVRRNRGSLAAPPGLSNHGYGVAVDFGGFGGLGNFGTANYRWMRANSERFGWYHPRVMRPGGGGPQEPWHWEFGTDS